MGRDLGLKERRDRIGFTFLEDLASVLGNDQRRDWGLKLDKSYVALVKTDEGR